MHFVIAIVASGSRLLRLSACRIAVVVVAVVVISSLPGSPSWLRRHSCRYHDIGVADKWVVAVVAGWGAACEYPRVRADTTGSAIGGRGLDEAEGRKGEGAKVFSWSLVVLAVSAHSTTEDEESDDVGPMPMPDDQQLT
ncbi:hypothetical protein EDB85DRAFT_1890331 [Lactarius pseudohatsudake]|nr:hypothetical protein EDB85DRAFT_1890331 [Lactarius pseudohatsudake]